MVPFVLSNNDTIQKRDIRLQCYSKVRLNNTQTYKQVST